MSVTAESIREDVPQYAGLRMQAEEYFRLANDGHRYELVNGVVILSPSPTPRHQQVMLKIAAQLSAFLEKHPVGAAYPETDVRLDENLVYRPEIVFLRTERVLDNWERIRTAPDLVVEIVSPASRRYDAETKRSDYERYGVREYWLIDPDRETMTFYRLESGRYVETAPKQDRLTSEAVPGFVLDLSAVRRAFRPLTKKS